MSDAPETEVAGTQEPEAPAPPGAPEGSGAGAATETAPAAAADPSADSLAQEIDDIEKEDLELSEMEARLLDDMDRLQTERNDYLDQLLRTRADFDNYRKRILKQQSEHQERAAESLVEKLLDALDTFDLAVAHGQGFEQAREQLVNILTKEGLERIDPAGEEFDPNEADAVAHEDGDGGPVVAEVLRPGYRWKGRVLRPAMVKVRG
ncbi:MAG: nucleotide exchange factor GrpE [Actinomycetota bacterium]|nr:nucleotide exchange factor GrpE [Actinomycetota bacterium]